MCKCQKKIGSTMKKTGVDYERLGMMVGGGALSGLLFNKLILKNLPTNWQTSKTAKFMPGLAKIGLGILALTQKNQNIKDAGIGALVYGGVEVMQQTAPDVFGISGTYRRYGDYLDMGAPSVHGYLNTPRNYRLVDDMEELHQVSGQHRLFNDGDDAVSGLVV